MLIFSFFYPLFLKGKPNNQDSANVPPDRYRDRQGDLGVGMLNLSLS